MGRGHVQVEEQTVAGNRPKWKLVVRQRCKGETTPYRSKEEEQWDGSDLTIVFQQAVSFLQICAEQVSKICLRPIHLLHSYFVGAFPVHWLP